MRVPDAVHAAAAAGFGAGAATCAAEAVPEMLQTLLAANADVVARAGTAERVPLPDAAMDAILCAQSFHWFASRAALAKMRRALKIGCAV